jgi:hypothetical protein
MVAEESTRVNNHRRCAARRRLSADQRRILSDDKRHGRRRFSSVAQASPKIFSDSELEPASQGRRSGDIYLSAAQILLLIIANFCDHT